jgi:hypothetical protein
VCVRARFFYNHILCKLGGQIILHDDEVGRECESMSFPKKGTRMAKEKSVRTPGLLSLFGILTFIVWPLIPL